MIAGLLKGSNNGVLRKGDLSRVAELYGSNRWAIAGLWKEYQRQKAAGAVCPDHLHNKRRRGNCDKWGIPQTLPTACACSFMLQVETVLDVLYCPVTIFIYVCSGILVSPGHPLTFFVPPPPRNIMCTR